MHIIFEEHQYNVSAVTNELRDISTLQDVDKKISVSYVGYYYNTHIQDCVFILPKVLLTDTQLEDGSRIEVVANVLSKDNKGFITPEDIITPKGQEKHLPEEYRKFIYEFAVWVYRSLCVYRNLNPLSRAIYYRQLPQEGRGRRHSANTYLDIILSLIRFNRENQNYFLFTIKNLHRGNNKINWTKTISKTQGVLQGDYALYLSPVNKKRVINFEEELFIIFFSILNYLNEQYGFRSHINWQYDLITGKRFQSYLSGRGKIRLRQIKYKYFSDKALQLWDLCFAFFEATHKIAINTRQKEYLLAKSFEHVFEAMIDELIGDPIVPKGLKEQRDGKRVDHMYTYYGLTTSDDQKDEIYYIGDSKYYKVGHKLGRTSIYKQYTYARNVIQWNIDLFMTGQRSDWTEEELQDREDDLKNYGRIHLRNDGKDPLTEGYNIIPNFFLSAFVNEKRQYIASENIKHHEPKQSHISFQFNDRLFDRDTLILSHYDVNFLYVLYLYARNKRNEKAAWRKEVRDIFRNEIRKVLIENYDFYALKSIGNPLAGEEFIKEHFKELQGKLFRPYADRDIYTFALEKPKTGTTADDNAYRLLREFFIIEPISLGENPKENLDTKVADYQAKHPYCNITDKNGVLMVMMENYDAKSTNFINTGKLAIGIKYTRDTMKIVEHINTIGYVLFHHRSATGQHLFQVKGECLVKSVDEIDDDRYKNVGTTQMYVVADIELKELDATHINSTNMTFTPQTRYDAQYATINDLLLNS